MTTSSTTIVDADGNNPTRGDKLDIVRTITGLTTAQTITKAWLTVKASKGSADVDAALQLVVTTASTDAGQITDDGTGDTEGSVTFTINSADYADITADVSYWYDIQILLSDGEPATLEIGRVQWEQDVTLATS